MRSLPLHCETIQVASAAGELRRINVSGLSKARLLWLFRNFSILDFTVLTRAQQQLIARVWYAGPSAAKADASLPALDLIGSIEGFSLKLCPPARTSALTPSLRQTSSAQPRARARVPRNFRPSVRWIPMCVLLAACAIYVGPMHRMALIPAAKSGLTNTVVARTEAPQSWLPKGSAPKTSAASQAENSAVRRLARVSESAPALAARHAPEAPGSAPHASPLSRPPAAALPAAMAANQSMTPAAVAPVAVVSNRVVPDPVASNLVVSNKATRPRTALASKAPQVLIRVSVDGEGRAQTFEVVQGDRKKSSAALAAAKHWSFQHCAGSESCEHTLRFTDYGDTSILQVID